MNESWSVECADCLEWLASREAGSADLVFGSPPYEKARTYGIDFKLAGQDWVDWMVKVFVASLRVSKGLVAFVVEGQTNKYRWTATPALLMADLHRAGIHLRKPPVYKRVGIPGSGGPDWLRNDYEFVICATNGGKLPWSDNTAMGHVPKWAPGGEMSHRLSDGARVNQWGGRATSAAQRKKDGTRQPPGRPSHRLGRGKCKGTEGTPKGTCMYKLDPEGYDPPAIANPGNVVECNVGGGQMGHELCHANEAPFPEALAEFFVRSFCPPGGLCIDPFSGSGTTGAVCVRYNRRFAGCDVRQSQVDLSRRRIAEETPDLFEGIA